MPMRFIPASLHVTRDIQHYYCMAHIRRMFGEAVNYDKERATWAVETVAGLYKREKNIREAGPPLTESQIVEKRMAEVSSILSPAERLFRYTGIATVL